MSVYHNLKLYIRSFAANNEFKVRSNSKWPI